MCLYVYVYIYICIIERLAAAADRSEEGTAMKWPNTYDSDKKTSIFTCGAYY